MQDDDAVNLESAQEFLGAAIAAVYYAFREGCGSSAGDIESAVLLPRKLVNFGIKSLYEQGVIERFQERPVRYRLTAEPSAKAAALQRKLRESIFSMLRQTIAEAEAAARGLTDENTHDSAPMEGVIGYGGIAIGGGPNGAIISGSYLYPEYVEEGVGYIETMRRMVAEQPQNAPPVPLFDMSMEDTCVVMGACSLITNTLVDEPDREDLGGVALLLGMIHHFLGKPYFIIAGTQHPDGHVTPVLDVIPDEVIAEGRARGVHPAATITNVLKRLDLMRQPNSDFR